MRMEFDLERIKNLCKLLVSIYRTPTEVIVADAYDLTKIYQVTSAEFHDKAFAE